jgi:glycosyltransferase involved in cell wall biosynthesis
MMREPQCFRLPWPTAFEADRARAPKEEEHSAPTKRRSSNATPIDVSQHRSDVLNEAAEAPQLASVESAPGRIVWMVNQYAMTPDLPGINRHYEFGWLLEKHGWKATVFATAFHHTSGRLRRRVTIWRPVLREQCGSVPFCWLYSTPYRSNNWQRYINMLSFMVAFVVTTLSAPRPDVVIGSSPHLLAGLGAWIAAKRHRVPFLLEVRDVWPDMLIQLGLSAPLVIKPLLWLERFLYARADRIITLTDGISERIAAKGVPRTKLVVVPNSMLPAAPLDDERRQARRRELGWDGKVVAVWAGSHNPMNGLDVVVEAARLLADRPSVLVAFIGDGSLKQQLIEQARGLPNVVFYDPVPKTDIGDFLRAADIGLVHSRRFDAFTGARPNKLFEYMAAGLPIVSTVPGEAWRLIEEAGAGIFAEWEAPQALAAAIQTLADAPERRLELGRCGHRYVRRAHDRQEHVAKLAAVLDAVAPLPSAPSFHVPEPLPERIPSPSLHWSDRGERPHAGTLSR